MDDLDGVVGYALCIEKICKKNTKINVIKKVKKVY